MITRCKKEPVENTPEVFGRGAKTKKEIQAQIEELYRQIGLKQYTVSYEKS